MSGTADSQSKILGILGGMGPQATNLFFQRIIDRTEASCDQEHLPVMIINDTGMPDRTKAILSGREEEVYCRLLQNARLLEQAGCSAISIPCNTSHYFVPRLQAAISIPIINMVSETVARLADRGVCRPAILATDGTIQTGIYQSACADRGIEGIAPDEETQRDVMAQIYDEIKHGTSGSPALFEKIDRSLKKLGCDAAILACTELSCYRIWHGLPEDFYFDAMEVLTEASILHCCGHLKPEKIL